MLARLLEIAFNRVRWATKALVLMSSEEGQTLPLGIANLTMSQKYQADWGALFAGLTIGVLPTLIMYVIFQRQIQEGLTAGAVKG